MFDSSLLFFFFFFRAVISETHASQVLSLSHPLFFLSFPFPTPPTILSASGHTIHHLRQKSSVSDHRNARSKGQSLPEAFESLRRFPFPICISSPFPHRFSQGISPSRLSIISLLSSDLDLDRIQKIIVSIAYAFRLNAYGVGFREIVYFLFLIWCSKRERRHRI